MTDEQQLIAEGLRDLHLPPPISGWPPAPGWWLLLFMLTGVLAFTLWWLVQRKRRRDPRRHAVLALTAAFSQWQIDGNPASYLQQSHLTLRQLAIKLAGRSRVSRLCGNRWVEWLEKHCDQPFPEAARFALAYGAYQKTAVISVDQLHESYVTWARNCHLAASPDNHSRLSFVAAQSFNQANNSTAETSSTEHPYA